MASGTTRGPLDASAMSWARSAMIKLYTWRVDWFIKIWATIQKPLMTFQMQLEMMNIWLKVTIIEGWANRIRKYTKTRSKIFSELEKRKSWEKKKMLPLNTKKMQVLKTVLAGATMLLIITIKLFFTLIPPSKWNLKTKHFWCTELSANTIKKITRTQSRICNSVSKSILQTQCSFIY